MKRLLAIFILAGFVAATAMAQQSSGTQSQHVSHRDSVNSAQTDNAMAGTNQSSKKKKKTNNKKSKKTKSQKTTSAPPQ